jgi:hypothetical protein
MNKRTKKLSLNKQTLRHLASAQLAGVHGGTATTFILSDPSMKGEGLYRG